jgi:hypothetical protein
MFAPNTFTGAANARVKLEQVSASETVERGYPDWWTTSSGRRSLMSIVMLIVIIVVQKANDAVDSLGAEMSGGGSDELHCHIRVRNV